MNFENFRVPPGKKIKLADYPTDGTGPFKDKSEAQEKLAADVEKLADLQAKLYAQNIYGVLILLQGIDAAGKDGTIKHVMSGINPAGCQVKSFKVPSAEELDHDYLWRYVRALPERGNIGIFNRSYYEEVLVVRVHPKLLAGQRIEARPDGAFWQSRFRAINDHERHLAESGTVILKFWLNVSKEEQRRRFLARIERPNKHWKFRAADLDERALWDDYMRAYEACLNATSQPWAPWYAIPADDKPFMRWQVAKLINAAFEQLGVDFPGVDSAEEAEIEAAGAQLRAETS
jgi:PPK2 family polyphosphate:nucleotide phosphotransferase